MSNATLIQRCLPPAGAANGPVPQANFDVPKAPLPSARSASPTTAPHRCFNHTFYAKELDVVRTAEQQQLPLFSSPSTNPPLAKGKSVQLAAFAGHMLEVDFSEIDGWSRPRIGPLKMLALHPGCKALHYGIQLCESMNAFCGVDAKIRVFRPDTHIARMLRSAKRASLPCFDADELVKLIGALVRIDCASIDSALYIRPTMIGMDPMLGVAHSTSAKLFVVSGPVEAPATLKPLSLLADPTFGEAFERILRHNFLVRAFPGGAGAFTLGSNYAPTILTNRVANDLGCHEVLWLFDDDEKLIGAGNMNIFIHWLNDDGESELITAPLTDALVFPGVMRDSLLTIAREWDEFKVSERYATMTEIKERLAECKILEIFGTGSTCVVSPIETILYKDKDCNNIEQLLIPKMCSKHSVMQRFYDTILGIQCGEIERPDWIQIVN